MATPHASSDTAAQPLRISLDAARARSTGFLLKLS